MSSAVYRLEVRCLVPGLRSAYEKRANHASDAGVDLFVPETTHIPAGEVRLVDMGIQCRMLRKSTGETVSYYLYPRSSIVKTPLQLANSVGIIDKDYRGNIKGAMRCLYSPQTVEGHTIQEMERLVQLCGPTLEPVEVVLVESLDETVRGSGGFGSTGN